jgi:hypothetical protein
MNAGKRIQPSRRGWPARRRQILITSEGPAALRAGGLDPVELSRRHRSWCTWRSARTDSRAVRGSPRQRPDAVAAGGLLHCGRTRREPLRVGRAERGDRRCTPPPLHCRAPRRRNRGRGQLVDLSVQEAIAHRSRTPRSTSTSRGGTPPRGSGPVGGHRFVRCVDGWIYLVSGLGGSPLAWNAIEDWLVEGGVEAAAG